MIKKIDERFVLNIPRSVQAGTVRRRNGWSRKNILKSLWKLRAKIIAEDGVDIFGVFNMTDCVEVNFKGELEAPPAEESVIQFYKKYNGLADEDDD